MQLKRFLTLILAVLMMTSLILPTNAFADEIYFEELYEEPYGDFVYDQIDESDLIFEEVSEEPNNEDQVFYEEPSEETSDALYDRDSFVENDSVTDVLAAQDPLMEEDALIESALTVDEVNALGTGSGPSITGQPSDQSVTKAGNTATFTVVASGEGTLSYQWQYLENESAKWTSWKGKTDATLSCPVYEIRNGWKVRCIVSDANGSTESNPASMTIEEVTEYTDESLITYSRISENTVAVIGYSGEALQVYVPSYVSFNSVDYQVTEIGENAFLGKAITSISLPNSITKIGAAAFKNCSALSTMTAHD